MIAHEYLKSGALVGVLSSWTYEPLPIHAIYPSARFSPASVRAFVAHVEQAFEGIAGIA